MATVAAVYFHALEYGDYASNIGGGAESVAAERFDELLRRFGLVDLVETEGTGLVCGAANALVDHPPSPFIDVDDAVRARCLQAATAAGAPCAVTNALAVQVQRQLAALAARLGRPLLAASLNASAEAIGASIQRELLRTGAQCSPAAPACFGDSVGAPTSATSLHATMLPVAVDGALPTEALPRTLPFLLARAARRGLETHGLECSGWGALSLAEALFKIARVADAAEPVAAAQTSEAAATFATRALVGNGTNSWAGGMLRDAGATMTMEAWAPDEGSGTYSHPWTASPALTIPRLLMGLGPLEGYVGDAWRVVGIRPFPTAALSEAALVYPSPRGLFAVAFRAVLARWSSDSAEAAAGGATVSLNVTVPGNTGAVACLPAYLLPGYGEGSCSVLLDDVAALAPLHAEGALLCWPHELSGSHRILVRCS